MAGGAPSVTFAQGVAPLDRMNIVKILAFFAGFTVLFPASALLASTDFYTHVYSKEDGESLLFLISIAVTITSPFIQIFVQSVQNRISYTSRIMTALGLNTILAAIFPFIVLFLPVSISFWGAIFVAFFMGINNAVLKVSFFSLTSYYPAKFQQDIVLGKGLSPLLVILLKMAIKGLTEKYFKDDHDKAIRNSAIFFFSLAAIVPAACAILYRFARKTSLFSKHYFPSFRLRKLALAAQDPTILSQSSKDYPTPLLSTLTENEDQEELHLKPSCDGVTNRNAQLAQKSMSFNVLDESDYKSQLDETNFMNMGAQNGDYTQMNDELELKLELELGSQINDSNDGSLLSPSQSLAQTGKAKSSFDPKPEFTEANVNKMLVLKKISLPAVVIGTTMFVTYTIYPAILTKSPPTIDGINKEWWRLILMITFALSDFIARSLPYSVITSICSVSNIDLLAYSRILCLPFYFYSDYVHTIASQLLLVVTVFLGVTNGLVFVICMRNYFHLVKDYEKSTAGSFMSIIVVVGVMFGNFFALFVDKVCR